MKRANKILLAATAALLPLSGAFASTWKPPQNTSGAPSELTPVIQSITNWILGFITVIAVLALLWGGIQYITAAGDENTMKNAKKTVTYAIVGLVIAGLSYALVTFLVKDVLVDDGGGGNGGGGNTSDEYVM